MPGIDACSWSRRIAILSLCALGAFRAPVLSQTIAPKPRVLVFYGCGGFVHPSIPYVTQVWLKLAAENGFDIDTSGSASVFTRDNLSRYAAVVFNNATYPGKTLDSAEKSAWLEYAKTGGYVGMHAAGDLGDSWPAYLTYMGGTNSQHSNTLPATLAIEPGAEAARHPIVMHAAWPDSLVLTDEWYSWRVNPRTVPGIRILYTLDEKTFTPGVAMGQDHPIIWTREMPEGGRMIYMGMGHNIDLFKPVPDKGYALMERLMRASLMWATKRIPGSGNAVITPVRGTMRNGPGELRAAGFLYRSPYSPQSTYLDASGRTFAAWSDLHPVSSR